MKDMETRNTSKSLMADNQIGYQYRYDAAVFLFDNKSFFFFLLSCNLLSCF